MKIIHIFSKQVFVYLTTSLQVCWGKKNPRQPIQQFLLNLKPVSRTAQKAEVLQKLPYKCKGSYTKAEQTNLLSFSTNTSEKSYTKLTECFNQHVSGQRESPAILTCNLSQPGKVTVSEKTLYHPQPMMTLLVLMHSFMTQNMKIQF